MARSVWIRMSSAPRRSGRALCAAMKLLTKPNDDVQFVELVNPIISALISGSFPEEIFVMKIDNWFDHKWLKFSGIGRVRFGDFGRDINTALDSFGRIRSRSRLLPVTFVWVG